MKNVQALLCLIGLHAWCTLGEGPPRERRRANGVRFTRSTDRKLCMRCDLIRDEPIAYWHIDRSTIPPNTNPFPNIKDGDRATFGRRSR